MFETLTYNQKRLLGVLALLISTIGIGLLLFWIFTSTPIIQKQPEQELEEEQEQVYEGSLTPAQQAQEREAQEQIEEERLPSAIADGGETLTQQLTSSAITSPELIDGTGIAFYNALDGRFYKIDESGEPIAISLAQFPDAETVTFSPGADVAAIEFPDGTNIVYNFETEEQTTLPQHWEEFDFSIGGNEFASKNLSNDTTQNTLVVSSSDGSRTAAIAPLGENANKVSLNWSTNNTVVGFSQTGATSLGFGRYEIYLIGQDGQESGNLIVEGGNFSAIWSPTSSKILYSVSWSANNERPSLWVADGTGTIGANRKNLSVETWVEKCTFKNDSVIVCAVPDEVVDGSGMDSRLIDSFDSLYEININTGSKKLLATTVLDMQMSNLSLSDDESILYFTDQYSRLNYIRLK